VHLACCPGSSVCRGCGIKHVTGGGGARACWQCSRPGVLSAHLLADELLRGAVLFAKENGGQHCKDTLRDLLQRKIRCLQQLAAGEKPRDDAAIAAANDSVIADDVVVVIGGGGSDNDDGVNGSSRGKVDLRHRISPRKAAAAADRDRRDEDRSRHKDSRRERDRERDRERERKREQRYRERDVGDDDASPQKDSNKETKVVVTSTGTTQSNGGVGAVGSFAALQRRIREEHARVEQLVAERIEAHIAAMVADQLRLRKEAIHAEVLAKLALARQNMEAELELELELRRKFRAAAQAERMAELEARMAEAERQVAEEQRRIAEERLAILENQASWLKKPSLWIQIGNNYQYCGSGIRCFFIPLDPGTGSGMNFFSGSRIFLTKTTTIISKKKVSFHSFFHLGSGIRDEKMFGPGSGIRKCWDPGPDPNIFSSWIPDPT
jgi:hypothetical protein